MSNAKKMPRLVEVFLMTARPINIGSAYSLGEGPPPPPSDAFSSVAKKVQVRPELRAAVDAFARAVDTDPRIRLAAPDRVRVAAASFEDLLNMLRSL